MKLINIIIILLLMFISCAGDILEEQENDENGGNKIYIVGGLSGSGIGTTVSGIDVYYPETDSWERNITNIPVPVSFAGVVSYLRSTDSHNLIFVIGGFNSSGVVQNLVQIYDVEDNSWSSGTVMTAARANIYASLVYDKIFILGGTTGNSTAAWGGATTNYEYTIGSSWNTRTAITAVSERFTYTFNDVVYHIGGRNGAGTVAAPAHEGYSATALAVTGGTEVVMSTNRTGVAGAVWIPSNGPAKVFLIGGFTAFTGTPTSCIIDNSAITVSTPSNLFQYLNYPFTSPSTWITTPTTTTFPLSVGFGAAVVCKNKLYHFGGTSSVVTSPTKLASGTVSVYSTDLNYLPSNTWTAVSNMPVGRYGHSAVLIQ